MSTETPDLQQQSSRSAPDWERIELDYRAGIKSLRQIASEHGISEGAIRKRAKRDDWTRDLSGRIQDKAEQLVRNEAVRSTVRIESKIAEKAVVDANAQAVADVRIAHRRDIARARNITNALLQELEQTTGAENVDLLRQLGDMLRNPDNKGMDKLNDLYQAIISLPERSKTMKVLAESLQKVVDMERQAFGMDKEQEKTIDPLGAILKAISENGAGSGFRPQSIDPERDTASSVFPIVDEG